jgi:hypothetical protein
MHVHTDQRIFPDRRATSTPSVHPSVTASSEGPRPGSLRFPCEGAAAHRKPLEASSGNADRCSRTRDRIGHGPCSDSVTGMSGVMPTALQRAASATGGGVAVPNELAAAAEAPYVRKTGARSAVTRDLCDESSRCRGAVAINVRDDCYAPSSGRGRRGRRRRRRTGAPAWPEVSGRPGALRPPGPPRNRTCQFPGIRLGQALMAVGRAEVFPLAWGFVAGPRRRLACSCRSRSDRPGLGGATGRCS